MANKKSSKKKSSSLFLTGVVVLALLIIAIIFLINKNQIISNFKDTGFFDKVFGSTPEFVQNHEDKTTEKDDSKMSEEEIIISLKSENGAGSGNSDTKSEKNTGSTSSETSAESENETQKAYESEKNSSDEVKAVQPAQETPAKTDSKAAEAEQKTAPKVTATTDLQLCFVYVSPEGAVMRQIVKRTVPKSDSPLTNAINLVLRGPELTNSAEKDLTSLIPSGTRLLGAKVQDGIAYLNFSSEFEQNSYGVDGYNAQLMQIVYTAAAFPTVNSVQFLIEGEKVAYLSEGIWIGSPLSKNSF